MQYLLSKPVYSHSVLITSPKPVNNIDHKIFFSSVSISPNYYTEHMGLVCKKEFALEKITKIPLRIRVGSLQQCNYLEGKK